jgi:hypothetical protein
VPKISELAPPLLALSGLELTPALQGSSNAGMPLLAYGQLPRGDVLQLRKAFAADLSATADADPGAGKVRWNHATPTSATMLYIDDQDGAATDISATWATLTVGGYVYVQGSADTAARSNWQKWQITSVTDASGYAKIGVSLQASAGSFADTDVVELSLQQPTPSPGVDRNVVTPVSSSAGVLTLDLSSGDFFKTTLTENITSIVLTNVPAAGTFSLRITQDAASARTVTFPATFLKQGGGDFTVSTTLGARDRIIFTTDDGGTSFDADMGKGYA